MFLFDGEYPAQECKNSLKLFLAPNEKMQKPICVLK